MSDDNAEKLARHTRKIARYEGITAGQGHVLNAAADLIESQRQRIHVLELRTTRCSPQQCTRADEAEAEVARLNKVHDEWQAVVVAPGFDEAVGLEAQRYHDSACIYQREVARLREVIEQVQDLLVTPSDERGITWWEWIDGGLGGSLYKDLQAILAAVPVEPQGDAWVVKSMELSPATPNPPVEPQARRMVIHPDGVWIRGECSACGWWTRQSTVEVARVFFDRHVCYGYRVPTVGSRWDQANRAFDHWESLHENGSE